jgi:predicted nucleic acid-binding Zn ribbon protein
MPVYEYTCPKCLVTQEITKPMSQSSREEVCGLEYPATQGGDLYPCGGALQRGFMNQGTSFQLRGTGWTGKIKKT